MMKKFLHDVCTTNEALWVVPWFTETNPRWRRPQSLILKKISITPDWIKIPAPNFVGRCITAMWRWPHDQKSKPEVNSHDIIKCRHGLMVEYRTRNREVAGSTHTWSTASNLEQVANLLCAQANSASYPQRNGKWVVVTATGWRPSVADWGHGVSASCPVGLIIR